VSIGSTHTVIGSRVTAEFAEDVREAAEAEERSVSYLIQRALRHELARVRNGNGHELEQPAEQVA